MPDVIKDLRRYADAVAAKVPEVDIRRVRPRRSHGRPRLVFAAAAGVALVVGTTLAVLDSSDGPKVVTADPTAPTSGSASTTPEATNTTLAAQSSVRTFPVTAIAEGEIFVWAGEAGSEAAIRADGFAINIASGAVRQIPPAPIGARSGATGVWTGTELIVCCGTGLADGYSNETQSAAAWNPATGEWRTLARPPGSVARSFPTAVWTGTEMAVIATGPAAAVYDPAADVWTEITPPPIRGERPQAAWTGEEVIVWDPVYGAATIPLAKASRTGVGDGPPVLKGGRSSHPFPQGTGLALARWPGPAPISSSGGPPPMTTPSGSERGGVPATTDGPPLRRPHRGQYPTHSTAPLGAKPSWLAADASW